MQQPDHNGENMRIGRLLAPLIGLTVAMLSACISAGGGVAACDRACLADQMSGYLAALRAHDLSRVRLSAEFRATQNGVQLAKGDGLASTLSALGDLQRRYYDPTTGEAAYLGLAREGTDTALIAVRIRVARGRISQSEAFVARKGDALFNPDGLVALPPRAALLPASERRPRAEMIAAANSYFEGLSRHDGSAIPKINGCDRLENGTRVTNRPPREAPVGAPAFEFGATDCASGLDRMTQIASVAHRRFPLVDEDAGVVMGVGLFLRPPGQTGNFAKRNLLTEFFETKDGKLAGIYAVMHYLDADAPDGTGWP